MAGTTNEPTPPAFFYQTVRPFEVAGRAPPADIRIGYGDNGPAPTWALPFNTTGSDFELTVSYRGRDAVYTTMSGALTVSNAIGTVTWPITVSQSKLIPPGGFATYRLRRIVPGGENRTFARGRVEVTLDPIVPTPVQIVESGPQGATGRVGSVGPVGPFSPGFGFANYADAQFTLASPLLIPGSARVPLPIDALAPSTDADHLRGVFAGSALWHDNRFWPRAVNDNYLLRVGFTGQPESLNNALKLTVDVGGDVGVVFEQVEVFGTDAGQYRDFSFSIPLYVKSGFIANGASIDITPATDMALWGASIEIAPLGAGA